MHGPAVRRAPGGEQRRQRGLHRSGDRERREVVLPDPALAVAVALGAGGWLVVAGRIEVGTVVAVVSGLGKLNDPWGDLVNWAREWSVDSVKYRLFADAVNGKGLATA